MTRSGPSGPSSNVPGHGLAWGEAVPRPWDSDKQAYLRELRFRWGGLDRGTGGDLNSYWLGDRDRKGRTPKPPVMEAFRWHPPMVYRPPFEWFPPMVRATPATRPPRYGMARMLGWDQPVTNQPAPNPTAGAAGEWEPWAWRYEGDGTKATSADRFNLRGPIFVEQLAQLLTEGRKVARARACPADDHYDHDCEKYTLVGEMTGNSLDSEARHWGAELDNTTYGAREGEGEPEPEDEPIKERYTVDDQARPDDPVQDDGPATKYDLQIAGAVDAVWRVWGDDDELHAEGSWEMIAAVADVTQPETSERVLAKSLGVSRRQVRNRLRDIRDGGKRTYKK